MHFNDLLIGFRLQLFGGAGALGTVAAYLVGEKVSDEQQRVRLRWLVSSGLFVLVLAAAVLDLMYYNRLLRGAVEALLDLERGCSNLKLSSVIEESVGCAGRAAPFATYALILLALAVLTGMSLRAHYSLCARRLQEVEPGNHLPE